MEIPKVAIERVVVGGLFILSITALANASHDAQVQHAIRKSCQEIGTAPDPAIDCTRYTIDKRVRNGYIHGIGR